MVWGLKTSVNRDVSADNRQKAKVRGLATAGLGILFVFCAPGQITKAGYSSQIKVAEPTFTPAAPTLVAQINPPVKSSEAPSKSPSEVAHILRTKSEIISIKTARKKSKAGSIGLT